VSDFLATIPERLWPTIETVCADMWEGYLKAIDEFICANPTLHAKLAVDRFHVAKQYRDSVDTVRMQESKNNSFHDVSPCSRSISHIIDTTICKTTIAS
jgi:transposase